VSEVERYYDRQVEHEWSRLERHPIEFGVTLRALEDYLPRPPAAILDVGGGPGRYSIALAARGYVVTLVDLSANCIAFARRKAEELEIQLAGSVRASAVDLGAFTDASFDAVLLMGPLYHLVRAEDRARAVAEARRVLKPEGLLFASFIGRYAAIIADAARRYPERILTSRARWERELETGVVEISFSAAPVTFTEAYMVRPQEVRPWLEGAGFATLDLIGCEGLLGQVEEGIKQLADEARAAWIDLTYRVGKDPSVHGAACHLLYVGRKQPD